jgi:hypothetical protein
MTNRQTSRRVLPIVAACGVSFAGCSDPPSGAGPAAGLDARADTADPCSSEFTPTDPTALIDDMEDRDGFLAPTGGRNGSWWLTADATAGTIAPPANNMLVTETVLGGRCGSRQAIRVSGQGFSDWGAAITANFKYTTEAAAPVDFSAFRGVRFWARVGETHSSPVRVQFQDENTAQFGGICNPTRGTADECWDGFGTGVAPLDTEWRLYELDFSRMAQSGFGYQSPALDTRRIYRMEWSVTQESVFDLWLDDVWLYR